MTGAVPARMRHTQTLQVIDHDVMWALISCALEGQSKRLQARPFASAYPSSALCANITKLHHVLAFVQ